MECLYHVRQIADAAEKRAVARHILESLPAWFGIPDAREAYIRQSEAQPFFAAFDEEDPIGFLCLKQTGQATVELCVMGVLEQYHRHGAGRALFFAARKFAVDSGYRYMQVKTVQMGKYPEYDITNRFYLHMGFQEFEVLPTLWDEQNPCQVYVMAL